MLQELTSVHMLLCVTTLDPPSYNPLLKIPLPFTCNCPLGVKVPIPTNPVLLILNLSTPLVLIAKIFAAGENAPVSESLT
jgi:hypothetical protein